MKRRLLLAMPTVTAGLLLAGGAGATAADALPDLEHRKGGRLGVFALDTASGLHLAWRADERFLMCSTFKALAAADVLHLVDIGKERLDRLVPYSAKDLFAYAPVTRAHVGAGALPVEALAAAAVQDSDNGAANLLLVIIGGPPGFTRFVRSLGDGSTRLDRTEMALNTPGGIRDTTTPRAMVHCLRMILLGDTLSPASRSRLEGWMTTSTTGLKRLRAGLPAGWTVGDKTGTGETVSNDIAIIRPPGRRPLLVAAYYDAPEINDVGREDALRTVGTIVTAWAQETRSAGP